MKKIFCLVAVVLAIQFSVLAQGSTPLRFLLEGAIGFGGDDVATVYFTNGNSQRVNAGQGIAIGVGGELAIPGVESLRLRSTVGFKYVTSAADNVHIRLTRIPINISGNYVFNNTWRAAVGMAFHNNIRFNAGGIGDNFALNNASGPFFEIAYKWIGFSFTSMNYEDKLGEIYSANSFNVTLSEVFPRRK
jgi:hypothetical protein